MLNGNTPNSYTTGADRTRKLTAETDEQGKYRFENLTKGYYKIVVSANGRAFDEHELIVGDGANITYNAELPGEHSIIGRVIGADDKLTVEDAVVRIAGRHSDPNDPGVVTTSNPQPTARLDADGTFAFEHLQTGSYVLEIEASGFETRRMTQVPLSRKDLVIELKKKQ